MGRRPSESNRVYGPYKHGRGWRYILASPDGTRAYSDAFSSKAEAASAGAKALETVEHAASLMAKDALDQYELERNERRRHKPRSTVETIRRLRGFFPADQVVGLINRKRGQEIYDRYCRTPTRQTKRPPADSTQLNVLKEARTFMKWCVGKSLARSNPFVGIETRGVMSSGKDQLRIDEARLWEDKAIELANRGSAGAVAALMTLHLGMRASEIVTRSVRDLDDDGRLMHVEAVSKKNRKQMAWSPKTRAGQRALPVPNDLRAYLLALVKDRPGEENLFRTGPPHNRKWVYDWVKRICALAKVPEVNAHGMRGLRATLDALGGGGLREIAARMGHEHESTTVGSYIDPSALALASQRRAMKVLKGGRK